MDIILDSIQNEVEIKKVYELNNYGYPTNIESEHIN